MNEETISVIIPIYNAEKYIRRCLDSIKTQTYKKLEIICVDDESTDQSADIVRQYCKIDERFRYYKIKNAGVSNARNVGLKYSSGNFIMFLDSDDWIDEETCAVAVSVMQVNDADIVMWPYVREYEDSSVKKKIFDKDMVFKDNDLKLLHKTFIGYVDDGFFQPGNADALSPVWGKLYKKSVLKDILFYDIKQIGSYEDGLYNIEVFGKARKVVYINRYFSHYWKSNSNSLTSCFNEKLLLQRSKLYEIIFQYIQKNKLDETYIEALKNRIVYEILYIGLNEMNRRSSGVSHIRQLKKVVCSKKYENAGKTFKYQSFPLHWRIFYRFAVHKNVVLLYLMLYIMHAVRKIRH